MSYEVNSSTLALIPLNNFETKVIEMDNTFNIKKSVFEIIKESCEYFGSTYLGRHEGTKKLIGISHKAPIIIEESKSIIYFPTTSPRLEKCIWFSLNNIKKYYNINGKTEILFNNNKSIKINISYGSFDNQFLRATKLESVLRKRKDTIE